MEKYFQEAINSIKDGDKTRGRKLLIKVLENDENNELAWLWLTKCLSDPTQKRECFNRVLEINPNNKHAKKGLNRLETLENIKSKSSEESKRPDEKTTDKKEKSSSKIIIAALFVLLTLLCVGTLLTTDPDEPSTGASPSRASIMCKNIVESQLVAPSTAKFANYNEQKIWTLGKESGKYDNAYRVRSYVDAQNSFGAKIRTFYTCDISYDGGEWTDLRNWTLLDLIIED